MKRKSKKPKVVQEISDYFQVETSAGKVVYGGNEEITVQINPHSYLTKKVKDLNLGENVVFDVLAVTTDLEDVAPYLNRNPLYARASTFIFEENSKGAPVPKLRIGLLKAMHHQGFFSCDDLESRIMWETTQDFPLEEYQRAATFLRNTLTDSLKEGESAYISEEPSIRAWLDGKTLAPRDHKIFDLFKRIYGSRFDHFLSHPQDNSGFYKNYRVYIVLRQLVMKTLNNWKAEGGSEEDYEGEKRNITEVKMEVNTILSEFLKDITERLKAVRVTKIQKQPSDKNKGNGIVRGVIPELNTKMANFREVYEEMEVLDSYLQQIILLSPCETNLSEEDKKEVLHYVIPFILKKYKEGIDAEMMYLEKKFIFNINQSESYDLSSPEFENDQFIDYLRQLPKNMLGFAEQTLEKILNAELDSHFGFEPYTTLRLIGSYAKTRKALPPVLFEYFVKLSQEWENKMQPKKKKIPGINEDREYLEKEYELSFQKRRKSEGGYFLTRAIEGYIFRLLPWFHRNYPLETTNESLIEVGSSELQVYVDIMLNSPKLMKKFFTSIRKGFFLRTEKYTRSVLRKYDLERITKLRQEEFVHDEMYERVTSENKGK